MLNLERVEIGVLEKPDRSSLSEAPVGSRPSKLHKIPNQVRLIVVARNQGQICPIHVRTSSIASQVNGVRESENPAKLLGTHANETIEPPPKRTNANTHLLEVGHPNAPAPGLHRLE